MIDRRQFVSLLVGSAVALLVLGERLPNEDLKIRVTYKELGIEPGLTFYKMDAPAQPIYPVQTPYYRIPWENYPRNWPV